ncbi:hypothetical protein GCM10009555_028810 [Acrocarpospora macrocephala]|uniref:Major facilitator superfamily (MFS) profile domain-containing protein n=1 Tax=Acrocarpospora macrocephala TaxID=150177 RepID=A0A5M3WV81_9ACTN|nr:MFS transporter [Acrocarpospora macrocephala]GES11211.1 hypothetical protein Amac_048080 [Acrocarpospora macrocephala]
MVAAGIPSNPSQTHQRPPRYRTALHNRHLLAVLLLILINATVYAQQRFALPLALTADGHPPSLYGLLITLNAILVVALQPLIMAWLTNYPRLTVLAASWALVGIGLALTGLATTPWRYALTVVIWSAGEIGMVGFSAALIADLTPAHAHATYQALYGWTGAIARVAAPLVGAFLYDRSALWWTCAATGVLCALSALLLQRRR